MKKAILIGVILLCSISIMAQAPQSFSYQAVARDLSGNVLANKVVSFRVSMLSGSATGTVVFSESHTASTNEYGLVELSIGKGTVITGNFSTVGWGSADLSNYAVTGAKIAPMSATDRQVLRYFGKLGIWGPDTVSDLIAAGSVTELELAPAAVTESKLATGAVTAAKLGQSGATTDQVWKWNGIQWAPATDNTGGWTLLGTSDIYTGKEVGIKTTNPQYPLDVYGTINCVVPGSVYSNPDILKYGPSFI